MSRTQVRVIAPQAYAAEHGASCVGINHVEHGLARLPEPAPGHGFICPLMLRA